MASFLPSSLPLSESRWIAVLCFIIEMAVCSSSIPLPSSRFLLEAPPFGGPLGGAVRWRREWLGNGLSTWIHPCEKGKEEGPRGKINVGKSRRERANDMMGRVTAAKGKALTEDYSFSSLSGILLLASVLVRFRRRKLPLPRERAAPSVARSAINVAFKL